MVVRLERTSPYYSGNNGFTTPCKTPSRVVPRGVSPVRTRKSLVSREEIRSMSDGLDDDMGRASKLLMELEEMRQSEVWGRLVQLAPLNW